MRLGQVGLGQPIGKDLLQVGQHQRGRRARQIHLLIQPLRVAERLHPRDL